MATLEKKGNLYRLVFCDGTKQPRLKKVPLQTDDLQKAQTLKALLEDRYSTGDFDPWISTVFEVKVKQTLSLTSEYDTPVGILVRKYLEEKEDQLSPASVKNYKFFINSFVNFVEADTPVGDITADMIREWLMSKREGSKKEVKPVTRHTMRRQVSVFLNWCIDQDLLLVNPCNRIKLGKLPSPPAKNLTVDELQHLLTTIADHCKNPNQGYRSEWMIPFITFTAYTGLRRGEVCHLKWKSLDIKKRTINVENDEALDFTTKSKQSRIVPLVKQALEVIESLLPTRIADMNGDDFVFKKHGTVNDMIDPTWAMIRVRAMRKKAGLTKGTIHGLRHTALTFMADRGVTSLQIKAVAGHADLKTSERYIHLSGKQLINPILDAFEN